MKRHRVTISALGTTGVLLAASLTMLALVSALVGFDAWPHRAGGQSPSDIAVQRAPAASLVRAIRPSPAARAAARARAAQALALAAAGSPSATAPGTTTPGTGTAPGYTPAPPPRVPANPPGAGPGGPLVSVGGPGRRPDRPVGGPSPSPVHAVACGAGEAMSGVSSTAAAPFMAACKSTPPALSVARDGSLAE